MHPTFIRYDVQLEAGGYLMGVVAALATQSIKSALSAAVKDRKLPRS
jgi:hypothetical protein